jgi:hypothetical protein
VNTDNQLTWLTEELCDKIRVVFEPKYGHLLSDNEVYDIANNLVSFLELILKNRGAQYEGK